MIDTTSGRPPFWSRARLAALALSLLVAALFVAAHAHLVVVAFASQPGCVPQSTPPKEGAATFRAAKPSC